MTKGFKDYVYAIPYFYRDHVHLMNMISSYSKHSKHLNGKEYLKKIKELSENIEREKEETSIRTLKLSIWENFKTEKSTFWYRCKEYFKQTWL